MIDWYGSFDKKDIELVKDYLKQRYETKQIKKQISVVFDLLHQCDIQCKGCGTNATYCDLKSIDSPELDMNSVVRVLEKIDQYAQKMGMPVFINFGGGEPFLRKDMLSILHAAADIFSPENIGIDTNGTLDNSYELIKEASVYCNYIGISVNGLEEYSSWWVGNNRINAYERQIEVIRKLCSDPLVREKVEVTSVATQKNIEDIPKLMEILNELNVKNYSVHRSIPVGRMRYISNLVPDAMDYFKLLISLVKKASELNMNCHLHHSIESIHTSLLLGMDTFVYDKIGNPDIASSIGIEPSGEVVYDPWCTTGCWKKLTAGNVISSDVSLYDLVNSKSSAFEQSKIYINRNSRCRGCQEKCSGGSRVVAAVERINGFKDEDIAIEDIYDAMCEKDPSCPLYVNRGE